MQAVERTLEILNAVARRHQGALLGELSADTGLSASTVHRYVQSMVELGYLHRGPDKRLWLGGRAAALSAAVGNSDAMTSRVRAALAELQAATGETSFASRMAGSEVVCTAMERGTKPLQLSVRVGQTIPPLHAASARVVLAHADLAVVERSWSRWSVDDPGSLTAFRHHLETIRERGFDICDSEFDKGIWAVAAPVDSPLAGQAYGALTVAGPATSFSDARRNETRDLVMSICRGLSAPDPSRAL